MGPPLTVDPGILSAAAKLYEPARNSAVGVINTLAKTLDDNWGCGGTDNAGKTWSDSYDPAAFAAIAAGTNIVNGLGKLHDLLGYTAVNHSNTETFKGAYGGDTDAPLGWGLVSRWLEGHTWPNGDPEKLNKLGTAWKDAAQKLRDAGDTTNPAWTSMEDVASDEMPQVLAQMDLVDTGIDDLATQYENLGDSCYDWANKINDAHNKIYAILATALTAGLIIGGVAGFFTLGTGAAAAAGGAGSAAAASIVTVLIAFDASAALLVGASVAAGVAVAGVANELQPLLDANPTTFNSSNSGGGGNQWHYQPAPKNLPGFPKAKWAKTMGRRKRWVDDDGNIYEWDYQHGAVEKYSKKGVHQGEYDPNTGQQTKPPDTKRSPEGK